MMKVERERTGRLNLLVSPVSCDRPWKMFLVDYLPLPYIPVTHQGGRYRVPYGLFVQLCAGIGIFVPWQGSFVSFTESLSDSISLSCSLSLFSLALSPSSLWRTPSSFSLSVPLVRSFCFSFLSLDWSTGCWVNRAVSCSSVAWRERRRNVGKQKHRMEEEGRCGEGTGWWSLAEGAMPRFERTHGSFF